MVILQYKGLQLFLTFSTEITGNVYTTNPESLQIILPPLGISAVVLNILINLLACIFCCAGDCFFNLRQTMRCSQNAFHRFLKPELMTQNTLLGNRPAWFGNNV
jgi:hypothetical protein